MITNTSTPSTLPANAMRPIDTVIVELPAANRLGGVVAVLPSGETGRRTTLSFNANVMSGGGTIDGTLFAHGDDSRPEDIQNRRANPCRGGLDVTGNAAASGR